MDSLRFLAQYDKNEEYRFLVATKINQDGVDCKRAIPGKLYRYYRYAGFSPFKLYWKIP
jgi:hypothetical protein